MEEIADIQNLNVVGESKQYIVIKLDDEYYGIDISYVDNIVRNQRITRIPKAQKYFKGVINLRGEIIPVMSLRLKFDLKPDEYTNATRIIIIKLEPQSAVGLIVDEVKEVLTLSENDIEKKYSIEDVTTNGIDLGNHIVFVIPDPQVIISLGGKYHVSKVTIEGHGVRRISDLDNHKISRRSRTVFQKITRVCNKLKNKL